MITLFDKNYATRTSVGVSDRIFVVDFKSRLKKSVSHLNFKMTEKNV